MNIEGKIKEILEDAIPLYYCEAGSRLWKTFHDESDYDVRGLHLPSKQAYFHFSGREEVYEHQEDKLEILSFDLDKYLRLLLNSNATAVEWLRSDVVYMNKLPDWDGFRQSVLPEINFQTLYHNYFSTALKITRQMELREKADAKTVLHCIRMLLSAEAAKNGSFAEIDLNHLLEQFKLHPVYSLGCRVRDKKISQEELELKKEEVVRELKSHIKIFPAEFAPHTGNRENLKKILSGYCFLIKDMFYCNG